MQGAYPSDGPVRMKRLFAEVLSVAEEDEEDRVYYTESLGVLEVLWARRVAERYLRRVRPEDHGEYAVKLARPLAKLLKVKPPMALLVLESIAVRILYCGSDGTSRDISSLDPGHEEDVVSLWGYLLEGTERCGEAVREAVGVGEQLGLGDLEE